MSKQKSKYKKTYLIKIDLKRTICPVCGSIGEYKHEDGLVICKKCECILIDPYPYSGGFRYNKDIRFAQKYSYPKEEEEK